MAELSCCGDAVWVLERDLGQAAGFDYGLGRCGACGTPAMSVFCVATGISGFERVTPSDLDAIRAISGGPALKAFMRQWGDTNL